MASLAPTFLYESRTPPFPWRPAPLIALALHVLLLFLVVTVEMQPGDAGFDATQPIQVVFEPPPQTATEDAQQSVAATEMSTTRPPPPNLDGGEFAETSARPRSEIEAIERTAEPAPLPEAPRLAEPVETPAPPPASALAQPQPPEPASEPAMQAEPTSTPPAEPQQQVAEATPQPVAVEERTQAPENAAPAPPAEPAESAEPAPSGAVQVEVGPTATRDLSDAFAVPSPPSTVFSVQPDRPRQVAARPPPPDRARPPAPPRPGPRVTATGEVDLFGERALRPRQVASAPPRTGNAVRLPRGALAGTDRPTQTLADHLLQQVIPHWRFNYRDPRFGGLEFFGVVRLRADGMLGSPHGKSDPLDFYAAINDYRRLLQPGNQEMRRALETFVIALRAAQPFRLPPGVDGYPRTIPVGFLLGEL